MCQALGTAWGTAAVMGELVVSGEGEYTVNVHSAASQTW